MKVPVKHYDVSLCVIEEQNISSALDKVIREMLVVCFPTDREYYQRQSWWHCVPIYRILGRDVGGSLVSHAALVERVVTVGPKLSRVRIAGVQSFCILPGLRGTGLSDRMMCLAMKEARKRGFDAGILFCLDQIEPIYARMGWIKLDAAVYMADDKKGRTLIPAKNITMFYPLRAKKFPLGDIDLAGTDW